MNRCFLTLKHFSRKPCRPHNSPEEEWVSPLRTQAKSKAPMIDEPSAALQGEELSG